MVTIVESVTQGQHSPTLTEKYTECPKCKKKIFFWAVLEACCYKCHREIIPYDALMYNITSRMAYHFNGEEMEGMLK